MTSRLLAAVASAALFLVAGQASSQAVDAATVHQQALVLDGHVDVLLPSTPARYYLPGGGSRADLDHLTRGGVNAVVLSLAVGPGPRDAAGIAAARADVDAKLARINALVTHNPDRVGIARTADEVTSLVAQGKIAVIIRTADEVTSLVAQGKIAVIIGFQNARSIGDDLSQIDALYGDGVRVFAFNHAGHNSWSDSSRPGEAPAAEHHGLSPIGRQAVTRLNDLGVLIDVSQLSSEALTQTLALSRAPVAATHSNVRALIDNTRNLSDAELDAIKANGGVVQLTPFNSYLVEPDAAARQRIAAIRVQHGLPATFGSPNDGYGTLAAVPQQAFLDALAPVLPRATVADYVGQIDYVAKRIGWQHVGIGTDFDHGAGIAGFDSEADAGNVTAELLRRGYSPEQVNAIWSGNFLRVLEAAQSARRS